MKIAYISSAIIPSRTANSIQIIKMCEAFAARGHDVVLFCPDRNSEKEGNVDNVHDFYGVKVSFSIKSLFWPSIKWKSQIYCLNLVFNVIQFKPTLIYSRYIWGSFWLSLLGYPSVLESHSPIRNASILEDWLLRLLIKFKKIQKLVVISNALKDYYLDKEYLKRENVLVAHDGSKEAESIGAYEEKLKGSASLNVGYVGSLYKGKGMEVVKKIAPRMRQVAFHIVGGMEKDIEIWKKDLDFENVHFYGFVPPKKVAIFVTLFDICLLPNQKIVKTYSSRRSAGKNRSNENISDYTSPLKMFDYMARSKAIVCSDIPVLREILNDENAVLADPEDAEAWIKAIEQLSNKEARERIGRKAYLDFISNYTWDIRAQKILMFAQTR